jgi:hypothetical protein
MRGTVRACVRAWLAGWLAGYHAAISSNVGAASSNVLVSFMMHDDNACNQNLCIMCGLVFFINCRSSTPFMCNAYTCTYKK